MCGIVGILGKAPIAEQLYESLIHLQHRGQDAAGIITADTRFHSQRGLGLVKEIFDFDALSALTGSMGIGHVRYRTAGGHGTENIQPFWISSAYGIALAHNGNLTNPQQLATELNAHKRHYFNTDSDSEVLLHLLSEGFSEAETPKHTGDFFEQICQATAWVFSKARGAYSIVAMIPDKGLIAFRDPAGIRPLVLGQREDAWIIASENTPFSSLRFHHLGDVRPGEVVFIDMGGHLHRRRLKTAPIHPCIFEYVYFSRPDALLNDVSVYRSRLRMGQNLAKRWKSVYPTLQPDVVIPVPFSSNTAALSFAHELGVRYSEGLYKNPFIGRTFIMASDRLRKRSVRHKLTPQPTEIRGKKVLLLDDSIVRGTTSREIVKMVREAGAVSVYFVSACPPVRFPCYYGIDIPTKEELIAHDKSLDAIQTFMGVDALLYQTEADLAEAVVRRGAHQIDHPCMACLNGEYVV